MNKNKIIWLIIFIILGIVIYLKFLQFRIIRLHDYIHAEGYRVTGDFLNFGNNIECQLNNDGIIYVNHHPTAKVILLIPYFDELIVEDLKTGKKGYYMDIREITN